MKHFDLLIAPECLKFVVQDAEVELRVEVENLLQTSVFVILDGAFHQTSCFLYLHSDSNAHLVQLKHVYALQL